MLVNLASVLIGFFMLGLIIYRCNILTKKYDSLLAARFCQHMLCLQASRIQGIHPAAIYTPMSN